MVDFWYECTNNVLWCSVFTDLVLRCGGPSGNDVARLNTASFKTRVIVKEQSRARLDCQYQNVQRTEWYLDHALIAPGHK